MSKSVEEMFEELGYIKEASGYTKYSKAIQTTIPEHSNNLSFAVYLLTDKDLRQYGDMACGNLHINKKGKLISVHEATHE